MQDSALQQKFASADRDTDRKLSREELRKFNDETMNFDKLDRNSDGKVSHLEWTSRPPVATTEDQ